LRKRIETYNETIGLEELVCVRRHKGNGLKSTASPANLKSCRKGKSPAPLKQRRERSSGNSRGEASSGLEQKNVDRGKGLRKRLQDAGQEDAPTKRVVLIGRHKNTGNGMSLKPGKEATLSGKGGKT